MGNNNMGNNMNTNYGIPADYYNIDNNYNNYPVNTYDNNNINMNMNYIPTNNNPVIRTTPTTGDRLRFAGNNIMK
jgi:hypothetical protein